MPGGDSHAADVGGTQTFDAPLESPCGASAPGRSLAFPPGTRIGRYVIDARLGEGGMGVVYAATDLDLERKVAIKVVRDPWHEHGGERHARLLREARAMARLDHLNVVRIFEAGTANIGDGAHAFIAMELIDGAALARWAEPRSWRERLAALVAAGRGLAAAHEAGLVHRDVKPDNILVDRTGRARIGDLGLAAMTREEGRDVRVGALPTSLTHTGAIMGTPAFMAPEQHRGEPADARTDQFGFCVTAWLIVYGQHPFELGELPAAVLAGAVRPPPRGEVPGWLEPLLRTGLAVEPARRHASMTALLDAIDRRLHPPRRWPLALAIAGTAGIASWLLIGAGGAGGARLGGAPASCPPPSLPALYVDAAAAPGGTGAAGCPFRTITEALAVTAPSRVIHVAAGRYDAAHGERLPLVVRGATALRGAGADVTIIAGLGLFDPQPDQLALSRFPQRATMVIGDDAAEVSLSELGLDGGGRDVVEGSIGVLCTRGNLHDFHGPIPPPNTRLDRVRIGNGYETGLAVSGSAAPRMSGCNLAVTGGYFHDTAIGIWQMGCGQWEAAAPTGLELEHSAFRALRSHVPPTVEGRTGFGVLVWDCAARTRIERSQFADSNFGVYLTGHTVLQPGAARDPDQPPVTVSRNDFASLTQHGVFVERAVDVELRDNTFHSTPSALAVYATPTEAPRVRARGNAFFGNRIAVEVLGVGALPPASQIDFGRADDPGDNHFNCNAVRGDPDGATVAIRVPAAAGAMLAFAGNRWDHAPPRVHRGRAADRAEVRLADDEPEAEVAVEVALDGATATGDVCPAP